MVYTGGHKEHVEHGHNSRAKCRDNVRHGHAVREDPRRFWSQHNTQDARRNGTRTTHNTPVAIFRQFLYWCPRRPTWLPSASDSKKSSNNNSKLFENCLSL